GVRQAFHDLHQHQFGYHNPDNPLEVVSARLTAVAKVGQAFGLSSATGLAVLPNPTKRPVYFDSGPIECPIYHREEMPAGTQLTGPAVVQEYASTTLLFAGDRAQVAATGELVIHLCL